jgi:hypothetical protein
MYKRATRSLAASLLGLALVGLPGTSFSQDKKNDKHMSETTSYRTNMSHQDSGAWSGHVMVMKAIVDKDFSNEDLWSILPLLQDLRNARMACDAKHASIYTELALSKGNHDTSKADAAWQDCQRLLADRQRDIWSTISDRVGADKANSLRDLVEPKTEDMSRVAYTDVHIQNIDTMLQDLDRMAAARIAATGGTPPESGVRAASTETTVTTRTTQGTPVYVTMPARVSERDLVDIIEDRVVANEIGNSDYRIFVPMHRDLNTTDLTFLREEHMKVWW